IKYQRRII
ncbi:hypothetical protein CP8484711_1903B, partial [Chlamydia psittaci 84-8471/1]